MPFEYSYLMEEMMGMGILSAILNASSGLFGIVTYVLTSLALYTMAQRRGLNRPWLAWIPVVNCWIVGSLSDQYRYVVKGEIKSRRKVLLTLKILMTVIVIVMVGICVALVFSVAGSAMNGADQDRMLAAVMGPVVGLAGLSLPMAGLSIAFAVIYYIAMYDIYRSMDPSNSVLFLVLSILFRITEPFFLFFNRNKDLGMPPRRQETVYQETSYIPVQPPVQEPWEQENKDYL